MNRLTTLQEWLAHCEQQHHKFKDRPLDDLRALRERLGLHFDCPVIVVAGTNGKGSSCAMLESIAREAGYRVGVYSKPHLVRFEERCRIDGQMVDGAALLPHFEAVEAARGELPLTWFEFTTFVILRALASAGLDLAVLEVGLGGRLDAVNVIDADCVLLTSIDLDHIDTLGDNREAIGLEKAHVMRAGRPAIIADPQPPQSVLDHGARVDADLWLVGRDFTHAGDRLQWTWGGRRQRYAGLGYPGLRGANQLLNAAAVITVLECLRERIPVSMQHVRQGLMLVELPGRFQVQPGRPSVVLDVAHNPQAAGVLADNLGNMGFYPETWAVLGMLADKDVAGVVGLMAGRVDHWLLADLPGPRGLSAEALAAQVRAVKEGADIRCFATPAEAYAAAQKLVAEDDRIVVFGSFLTVSDVLAAIKAARRG